MSTFRSEGCFIHSSHSLNFVISCSISAETLDRSSMRTAAVRIPPSCSVRDSATCPVSAAVFAEILRIRSTESTTQRSHACISSISASMSRTDSLVFSASARKSMKIPCTFMTACAGSLYGRVQCEQTRLTGNRMM